MDTDEAQTLLCIHGRRVFMQPDGSKHRYWLASYHSKRESLRDDMSWGPEKKFECHFDEELGTYVHHPCWILFEAMYEKTCENISLVIEEDAIWKIPFPFDEFGEREDHEPYMKLSLHVPLRLGFSFDLIGSELHIRDP